MNYKRTLGLIMEVVGVVMFFIAGYIKGQVEQGRGQISSGQKKVDTANSLFSVNPVTKEVGKGVTSSAQREINQGRLEANKYDEIANWLRIGGIVVVIVGAGVLILGGRKKSNHHHS